MEALGLIVKKIIPLKVIPDCGAVLGPTILIFAALRFATTMLGATTTAAVLVFVLSAMAGELFNPFLFSPFALCPVLLFPLPPAERENFFGPKVICLKFATNGKSLKLKNDRIISYSKKP
jgi:hypothetical protein